MGTMAAKLSPTLKAVAREKDNPKDCSVASNLQLAKSIEPFWPSLSLLPNAGAHPEIQLPAMLFGDLATQVHTWLQPGEVGDLVLHFTSHAAGWLAVFLAGPHGRIMPDRGSLPLEVDISHTPLDPTPGPL